MTARGSVVARACGITGNGDDVFLRSPKISADHICWCGVGTAGDPECGMAARGGAAFNLPRMLPTCPGRTCSPCCWFRAVLRAVLQALSLLACAVPEPTTSLVGASAGASGWSCRGCKGIPRQQRKHLQALLFPPPVDLRGITTDCTGSWHAGTRTRKPNVWSTAGMATRNPNAHADGGRRRKPDAHDDGEHCGRLTERSASVPCDASRSRYLRFCVDPCRSLEIRPTTPTPLPFLREGTPGSRGY
jgi:hypothetical protein